MANQRFRKGLIVVAGGIGSTALILGVAMVPGLDGGMFILLPGILLSALMFSTGIHSDHAIAFIIVAAVADIAIFGGVVLLIYETFSRRRERKAQGDV